MRYTRIVLEGLLSFALPGIKRLEWTPHADYQMILGTNGSGKSTLMREISPCPGQADRYAKGGCKLVELEHEHADYVLLSTFPAKGTPRHSFVRNGVELNAGGTQAIQRELVAKHFNGYNEKLHDLLIGHLKERFTRMNTEQRKHRIMTLPRSDYSFAQAFVDKVKSARRDMEGVLKKAKLRLNEETAQLHAMADADGIEERVVALQADLTALLYARSADSAPWYHAEQRLQESLTALQRSGQAVERVADGIDLRGTLRSPAAVGQRLAVLEAELALKANILEHRKVEHSDIEAVLGSMQAAHIDDVSDLSGNLAQLTERLLAAETQISLFPELRHVTSADQMERVTVELLGELLTLFAELPDNADRRFSKANFAQAQELRRRASDEISKHEAGIRTLRGRIHTIQHTDGVTCPECQHTWVPGLSPRELPQLEDDIQKLQQAIAQQQHLLAQADTYIGEMEGYMATYRRWLGYTQQYPVLRLLWEHIRSHGYDTDHPGEHQDVFHHWTREVGQAVVLQRTREEIAQLEALQKATHGGQVTHFRERLATLEQEIGELTVQIKTAKAEHNDLATQHGLYLNLEEAELGWERALTQVENAYFAALDALASDVLNRDITRVQGQLGALQHTHNAKQVLLGVIASTERMLLAYEEEFEALDLIAREMRKLIADSMLGFIECFVLQLNSVIQSVWSYDLQILPCGMKGDDLDYDFPYLRGADTVPVKDVSETSTSIGDIIDFAFRLTVMLYMGLEDFPLFIDELGASFDEKHRPVIHAFISRLMESKRYSQVFMISHYVAGWGSFSNAEYLVLHALNITVPEPHNTHAVLT